MSNDTPPDHRRVSELELSDLVNAALLTPTQQLVEYADVDADSQEEHHQGSRLVAAGSHPSFISSSHSTAASPFTNAAYSHAPGTEVRTAGSAEPHPPQLAATDSTSSTTATASSSLDEVAPKQWISKWLRPLSLWGFAVFTCGLIGGIVTVCVVSSTGKGLARVNPERSIGVIPQFVPGLSFTIGITWTALPVLIIQLYNLAFVAIVRAGASRQPYVELRNDDPGALIGAPTERSVSLDYSSSWLITAPFEALKFGHWVLVVGFATALVSSLILPAIAAHLFYASSVIENRSIKVQQSVQSIDDGFGARSSFDPVYGALSTSRIYNGRLWPWTTLNTSITPFRPAIETVSSVLAANFTVPVDAYSASLDCEVLDPGSFELLEGKDTNWYYSLIDRGCKVLDQVFTPTIEFQVVDYVQTFSVTSCGGNPNHRRVIVIGAHNGNGSRSILTNKTAVSCIPNYYNLTGSVSVTFLQAHDESPLINNFTETSRVARTEHPVFAGIFQDRIVDGAAFDPTSTMLGSEFGKLILAFSMRFSSDSSYMNGDRILNATQSLFATAFAVMAQQYLYSPISPKTLSGTLYTAENRLLVSLPIAYTMLAILTAALVTVVLLYFYTRAHLSILYEEPRGLLGAAAILRNSTLLAHVEAIPASQAQGKVASQFRKSAREEDPTQGWTFRNWHDPGVALLDSTDSAHDRPWYKRRT